MFHLSLTFRLTRMTCLSLLAGLAVLFVCFGVFGWLFGVVCLFYLAGDSFTSSTS